MIEIVQNGHKVLREKAKTVKLADIQEKSFVKILKNMKTALDSQSDGVAIAAPQIAVPLRIFIVSGRIFDEDFVRGEGMQTKIKPDFKDLVFINPIIKKISKDKKLMSEGCLSVRPLYGKVRRASRTTVEAYNESGVKFEMEGSGLLSQIFQHEIDHLDGILFIDKARDIHEITPEPEQSTVRGKN